MPRPTDDQSCTATDNGRTCTLPADHKGEHYTWWDVPCPPPSTAAIRHTHRWPNTTPVRNLAPHERTRHQRRARDVRHTVNHAKLLHRDLNLLVARLHAEQGGYPTGGALDAKVSGSRTVLDDQDVPMPAVGDPTGEAAIDQRTGRHAAPDAATQALHRLDDLIATARRALDQADQLRRQWLPPQLEQRRHLAQRAAEGEPGCQSCARLNHWNPVARTGTAGDRLPEPMRLCGWCYKRVLDHAATGPCEVDGCGWTGHGSHVVLPARKLLADYLAGKRVMRKAS